MRAGAGTGLATCGDCLAEIADPLARRYRYPFTNCTACGPRFTIARDVPWDRAATTMAPFAICDACRAEYDDPCDRRFHAQPIACPRCGPRLSLHDTHGADLGTDDGALVAAGRALRAGRIVAVKGLGGFHLACDATSATAVARLRVRKRREAKPLAVMVRDVGEAVAHALLSADERVSLSSPARPIVLLRRRADSGLAAEVAPDSPLLGLLLAYTPLHHLLLQEAGRPLVMTSGNLAEEPLAWRDDEALARLGGVADLFLGHDRAIEAPCDDSVVRVIATSPTLLRRARGHVPGALPLARPLARPVLACGALLKNAFCVAAGVHAHLGPHVGDLENLATLEAYEAAILRALRFLRVTPEVVAHDLHPDYASTRHALARPETVKVGVQHHHAHVAAVMAEHRIEGPVIGIAWDGTGHGTDGTAWGGEFLLATLDSFERLATFRPLPLAGGDRAVRDVWRSALALLEDAFDGAPPIAALRLFDGVPRADLHVVRQMLAPSVNAPRVHGVGRYFDAFGALGLARPRAAYEGEIALLWNVAADASERGRYPFHVDTGARPWQIDLRLTARAAVSDLIDGRGAPTVSARFHRTLVTPAAEVVRLAVRRHGRFPIVLAGGCFQNPWLAEGLSEALTPALAVWLARDGSGKTAVLEALARHWHGTRRLGALAGDLATENDANRLAAAGIPSLAITTGSACHLDADMVHAALHRLDWRQLDLLFVENVGNLVCPAVYDLGQDCNVVALAVTEGLDKPLKYPVMFKGADLVLVTKTDLLPHLHDVSLAGYEDSLRRVMPRFAAIAVCATTGEGLDRFATWLEARHVPAPALARE